MKIKERLCKKIVLCIFSLLVLCRTAGAQTSAKATLSAADAGTCIVTSTACLILDVPPGSGGATFSISANGSANTAQFEASADYGVSWVALNATPSNSTTAASSTTSTGTWQANVAAYTKVRMRISTLVAGTTATYINLSTASARSNGGGGSVTHTAGNLTAFHIMIGNGAADATVDSACVTNGTGALSGCTSLSAGSGASAAGATATGGFAAVEAASTGWTPTVGQDYCRADSTVHNFVCALNGAAETPQPMWSAVPVGGKCAQTTGVAGFLVEATGACASAPSFPVTVSGTTTSGGIPYFSSTTVETSSALLATNALVVGGGAGGAPATGSGDFTYATHTLTMGAAGLMNLGAGATGSFILPIVSGNAPSTNGALQFDSSNGSVTFGSAGSPFHFAVASGGSAGTDCSATNKFLISVSTNGNPQCSFISQVKTGAITIGSGADIAATSLCSTAICTAGDYEVTVYINLTTPCGTTGTFIAWLGYTDDSGARTGSSTTTFFDIQGIGSVPATGTLTTTSTSNWGQAVYVLHTTGAATGGLGAINYGATRTACGTAGPMVGKMYLTVKAL